MKKLKKALIIVTLAVIIIFVFTNQKVFANNTKNILEKVEYSEDFKKWLELSDEEKKNVMQPRMYDVKTSATNNSNNIFYKARLLKASIEEKYSLKDIIPENLKIRNQQQTNSCWAFTALSSLETNIALTNFKNGVNTSKIYDYSERHMEYATSKTFANNVENKIGYNRAVGSGGGWYISEAYLTNGSGAIDEKLMPFENNENNIDISQIQNKTVSSQVYDTVDIPDYAKTATTEEKTQIMNQIKQHIQNYGTLSAAVHGSVSKAEGYNNDTGALYCNNEALYNQNHAISIIGWDDNYSVDNFVETARPTSNGAWIARNSWGEKIEYKLDELKESIFASYKQVCIDQGWNSAEEITNEFIEQNGYTIENDTAYQKIGDNGIIYVSYEDCNISKNINGIIKATDTVNYENIYQYDEYYPSYQIQLKTPNVMLCNIFDKKNSGTEYLTQVSLYAPETYTCKVYVNPNGASNKKSDMQLVQLKAGEQEVVSNGYHTLEFAKAIELTSDKFAVVIEIQEDGKNSKNIGMESRIEGTIWDSAIVETGKCFLAESNDLDNCKWIDLGKLSQVNTVLTDGDSTIKAFTVSELTDGSIKNIEITTPPTKTSYFEGENFDKTGMVVTANYNSKTNQQVILDSSNYSITDGNSLKLGQTSVTITYEGESVKQPITVEKNDITKLEIKTPPTKTEYKEGYDFDKTGMVIEATYKDLTTKEITDYTIENGKNLKNEQTEVTISFGEKSIKQAITVTPNPLTKIEITNKPNKTSYTIGEDFDKSGMIVTGVYTDGLTKEIIDYTIENGTKLTKEQTEVTITYEGKTVNQSITVKEAAKNSNFDNSNCNVNTINYYMFSDKTKQEYITMDIEISGISRNSGNDRYEYYYYLSSSREEKNIDNWIKIVENQTDTNKIKFQINTKDIKNMEELASTNNVYLYVKEVAIKGESESIVITAPIEIKTNVTAQIYVDNAKIDNANIGQTEDSTIAKGKLPNTGIRNILIVIFIITILGAIVYIRYKNLSKYIK